MAVQRAEYQQRMETLCAGIEEHCKGYVRVIKPKGGFFLWIELLVRASGPQSFRLSTHTDRLNRPRQDGLEVEEVYYACVKHGITMSQGPNFYWETDPSKASDKHLRLAFTSSTQEQLAEVRCCSELQTFRAVDRTPTAACRLLMSPAVMRHSLPQTTCAI